MFPNDPDFRVFRTGPLRGFHRHPRWPEQDAFYALGVEPEEVVAAVNVYGPHPHHMITVFTNDAASLPDPYAKLDYRSTGGDGQPFMRRRLNADASSITGKIATVTGDVLRDYVIERDGKPVCTGRYIMTPLGAIYVYGMETHPNYRRQGLASALMAQMHADAAADGATASILCSSPMGRELYHALDYETLATMCAFVPDGNAKPRSGL